MSNRLADAAAWLSRTPPHDRPRALIPALRDRFALSLREAVEAIRLSRGAAPTTKRNT